MIFADRLSEIVCGERALFARKVSFPHTPIPQKLSILLFPAHLLTSEQESEVQAPSGMALGF